MSKVFVIIGLCIVVAGTVLQGLTEATHVPGCNVVLSATDENGKPVTYEGCEQSFTDDFEGEFKFKANGWHKFQYMGNKSNKVEQTTEKVHSGKFALRSYTAESRDQQKASLARELLYFPNKSNFWMSAWYYIPAGTKTNDVYLFDLESTQGSGNPGRRLMLSGPDGDWLHINSKRAGPHANPTLHNRPVAFPKDKWVHVTIHMYISTESDGLTEVWQDGVKVISKTGQTIPSGMVYDWIEIGTSANVSGQAQIVYVDDLVISKEPIPEH